MEFGQRKIREIDLFDFTSFFFAGLFLIFWPTVAYPRFLDVALLHGGDDNLLYSSSTLILKKGFLFLKRQPMMYIGTETFKFLLFCNV